MRTIIHVDLNSFFATAQQQMQPELRGKPVAIVKAKGRTCCIAASVEAKRFGVNTGCDIFTAKRLCPQIIFVCAQFDRYEQMSYKFIDICKSYSPTCEVFSLDECFIDVTESQKFFGGVLAIVFDIKDRLRCEVGDYMTCSGGISHNRLLAKLASSQIKPDGLFVIDENNATFVLDRSDLMDVCGLGWGLYKGLISLGINSFAKIRAQSPFFLAKHFGPVWSVHLYNISRGIDNSPVTDWHDIADAKSVGRTYTTHRVLTTRAEILKLIRNLSEEAAAKARKMGLAGRYVGLVISGRQEGWSKPSFDLSSSRKRGSGLILNLVENDRLEYTKQSFHGHRTLKTYIDDGKVLFDICRQIFDEWKISSFNGRFFGITLAMLTKKGYMADPLFPEERRWQRLTQTVDRVNGKYGDYTVFPAQLLGMPIIRPEVTGYFGDKKFRLNFLRKA